MLHCYDSLIRVFRENFQTAKECCEKVKECPPEMKEDLLLLTKLFSVINADNASIVEVILNEGFD